MKTRDFKKALAKHGLTADIKQPGRGTYVVIVDTPNGKCYEPGLHSLLRHTLTGYTEDERARVRGEALAEALAYLPLEDCKDPECDVCEPDEP